jgi:ribonucleoside-triphosphate reductase (thioredoxin)
LGGGTSAEHLSLDFHSEKMFTSLFSSNILKPSYLRSSSHRSFGRRTLRYHSSATSSTLDPTSKNMLFKLHDHYVESYATKVPPFGFNGLGELVYMRTYSRVNEKNQKESWYQTVERVVNGTYSLQKEWMLKTGMPWDEVSAQEEAKEMYDRMFTMKFLPPGD